MGLLRLAGLQLHRRSRLAFFHGEPGARSVGGPVPKVKGHGVDHFLMGYVACHAHDQIGAGVLSLHILHNGVPGDLCYGLLGAAHVAPKGLVGPHDVVNEKIRPVAGDVVAHGELFQDDRSLLLHLFGFEQRLSNDVRHHIKGKLQVCDGNLAPVGCQFPVGGGIEHASHSLNGLADFLGCRTAACPLEAHVLNEMGDPCHLVDLIPGPCANVQHDAGRLCMGHLAGEDSKSVVGYRLFEHVLAL